jgi:lipopolysaccharide/colanic/teichoic acid biosynthesis glycosyltransferase
MKNNTTEDSSAKFATDEQDRILKTGKIIRQIRLDEILQFYDILKGDMSFVGPRPEQIKFVEEYNELIPFYWARHKLKPGLTGWAQIMYKYSSNLEEVKTKLSYDLYYVKNSNIFLDVNIVFKTIEAVFWKRGAV